MGAEIEIRVAGRCGRITLRRPAALNALTLPMIEAIDAALRGWAEDDSIAMLLIDAEGDRAFCAGGDLAEIYATGIAGDYSFARRFWRTEYRMNARLFEFPKPVATFLQGFTMGGGVGVGCHGSHRVVGDDSRIAMPEVGLGLVPDVGGSLLLARAPGRLGEYLAVTARRMGPGDAIRAGFADYHVPEADWPQLIAQLERTADWRRIDAAAGSPPPAALAAHQPQIDNAFGGATLGDVLRGLEAEADGFAHDTMARMAAHDPLAMAAALDLVRRARGSDGIRPALAAEYRFTHRAPECGDFLEGIRALIIDKDRRPVWRHDDPRAVPARAVSDMLMPLGEADWRFEAEEEDGT
jgi:enoyl-CoA hydratase/carnithine racemase